MARRTDEPATETLEGVGIAEWENSLRRKSEIPAARTETNPFAGLPEKAMKAFESLPNFRGVPPPIVKKGTDRKGVRTLPFTESTFKLLAGKLRAHGSIAKAISRSDVPLCSFDGLRMPSPCEQLKEEAAYGKCNKTFNYMVIVFQASENYIQTSTDVVHPF